MSWTILHVLLLCTLLTQAAAGPKKSTSGGSKACSHTGFFSKKVVPMCERHFPEESSKNMWVVQFYHPHVKKVHDFREAYEQLAAESPGGVKVGAVDCANNGEFCAKHGIREAPTTRAISAGRARDFGGEHTLEALKKFAKDSVDRFKEMDAAVKCDIKGLFTDQLKDAALPLCTASFPPALEPIPWIVSFYEKGDRNKDKSMRGVLNKVAVKYGGTPPKKVNAKKKTLKLHVGAVDCANPDNDCEKLGVKTLPTVRFYRSGAEPTDFDSFIDTDELKQWADARLKEIPPPEKVEVLKADMPVDEPASKSEEL